MNLSADDSGGFLASDIGIPVDEGAVHQIAGAYTESTSSAEQAASGRVDAFRMLLTSPLSRLQMIVGVTAGLISIGSAVAPVFHLIKPMPTRGEVVAVVHDLRGAGPLTGATVEILTPDSTVITTLTPQEEGRARHTMKEGVYRLLVTHPKFVPQMRQVHVSAGQIAEVRFNLAPRPAPPAPARVASKEKKIGFFKRLISSD